MKKLITVAVAVVFLSIPSLGQPTTGGAASWIINDAGSRCIHVKQDAVWLQFVNFVSNKEQDFLTKGTSVGVLLQTTIAGKTGGSTASFTLPQILQYDVRAYREGGIEIPVKEPVIVDYILATKSDRYEDLHVSVKLLKQVDANGFGTILNALTSVTGQLPLPPSPYTTGFQLFSKYAAQVVQNDIKGKNSNPNDPNLLDYGSLDANFSPSNDANACGAGSNFASTGVAVIVAASAEGTADQGYLQDVTRRGDYCWYAEVQNGDASIKFAPKKGDGSCDSTTYRTLKNPHLAFILNAYKEQDDAPTNLLRAPTPQSKAALNAQQQKDRTAALKRCAVFGIPEKSCIPQLRQR